MRMQYSCILIDTQNMPKLAILRTKIAKFSGEKAQPLPKPYLRWVGDNLAHILPILACGHSPLAPPGKNPTGAHETSTTASTELRNIQTNINKIVR